MSGLPIRISKKAQCAVIPFNDTVNNVIPHCRSINKNGKTFLLIPAHKEELQLLKNLGYETPSPLSISYDWNGVVPFEAQVATTDLLVHSPRAYVLNDMGTGKTLSVLFAYDYLRQQGLVNKMLVIAPLSTLTTVWEREVFSRMGHYTTAVLHGSKAKRLKSLEKDVDIYVINHDGPKTICAELMARHDIDCVVIDELAVFRNKRTDRWKFTNKVCEGRKYLWGLTGSPMPSEPTDAWAQIKLITPNNTTPWFKGFRDQTMTQVNQFLWLPKSNAHDIVYEAMQPAVRFTMDDCVDLPPTTHTTLAIALTKEQDKVYKEMMKQCYAQYQAQEIVAANEAVKIGKLLQVVCGFAYDQNGVPMHLPASPRYNELTATIDACRNKIIVFVEFKFLVDDLFSKLDNDGYSVAKVYGDTPKKERDDIFLRFQQGSALKVLVAHPKCMAHGLTLTAADTIVWYIPPMSLEIYEQANARIPRPGQKNHTHIVHFESSKLEKKIYARLQARGEAQGALLDLFEEDSTTI